MLRGRAIEAVPLTSFSSRPRLCPWCPILHPGAAHFLTKITVLPFTLYVNPSGSSISSRAW